MREAPGWPLGPTGPSSILPLGGAMTIRKGEASPSSLQKSLGSDFQLPSRLGSSLFQGWRPVQGWPESPHPLGGGSSTPGEPRWKAVGRRGSVRQMRCPGCKCEGATSRSGLREGRCGAGLWASPKHQGCLPSTHTRWRVLT